MTTFIIREKENGGALVPLRYVVQQLPFVVAATWCFRWVQVNSGRPFGLFLYDFEELTRQSPNGYCVPDADMRKFIDADIQVVDGEIDAIAEDGTRLVTIECFDASQWEIHTSVSAVAEEMEKRGFAKSIEGAEKAFPRPMKTIAAVLLITIGAVLLADRVDAVGERIPYVLLLSWAGSATIAALVFSRGPGPRSTASAQMTISGGALWAHMMRPIGVSLLPLAWVPLLEMRRWGHDPALWLINGVLIVSLCSVPYWWQLARSILGAVVLSICSLGLLWHLSAWGLFEMIIRTESAKDVSTVDTTRTLHAFLAPEYRGHFYLLCGLALLVYCPLMMWFGYRRFVRAGVRQDA